MFPSVTVSKTKPKLQTHSELGISETQGNDSKYFLNKYTYMYVGNSHNHIYNI